MVIAVCIIVWILCDIAEKSYKQRSNYEYQARLRHQEDMKQREEHWKDWNEAVSKNQEIGSKQTLHKKTRTIVREAVDENGRVIRETITEEI